MKPRLHVLLASQAPVGVVLRRGPSRAVAAIGWDRRRDRFELGQWLRGRIYEKRSDLAPDGKHLIYFAMNGRWSSATGGAWTAVSRAPYLKAIALYAKGDCWHGGGLFVDARTYWLNDGYGHRVLADSAEVTRAAGQPYAPQWGGECWGVYFNRLARDGWQLRLDVSISTRNSQTIVWEKPLPHGWTLRKLAHASLERRQGLGVYHDEHELLAPDGRELPHESWEWAELDHNRLVWAEEGALWAAPLGRTGPGEPRLLHDFSAMTFEAIAAPYGGAAGGRARTMPA